MTWTNFHSCCRLLAVGHTVDSQFNTNPSTRPEQILAGLLQLPAEQRLQSSRLYGQLDFEQSSLLRQNKNALLYISLLFVMFIFISTLHLVFVWPGFDNFYQQIEPQALSASANLRQLWPLIMLFCAGVLLLCWLYYFAIAGLVQARSGKALAWLLPGPAKQLYNLLTELTTYPLQMHNPINSDLQQRLQPLLSDPQLLLCELRQQWQQHQQQLTKVLTSKMQKLQLLSGIVMVCAIAQLMFINYKHLFDMGVVI